MDPVGVGALEPAPLHLDRMAGVPYDGCSLGNVLDDDRVRAYLCPVSDIDRPQKFGAGADGHVVVDCRVPFAALEARASQGHTLIERHPVADLSRLADHHAGAVVDEEVG